MKAEQSKFIASLKSEANGEADVTKSDQKMSISEFDYVPEESVPVCSLCRGSDSGSPLCFLILLQVPNLCSVCLYAVSDISFLILLLMTHNQR